jgi:hypothetical protein
LSDELKPGVFVKLSHEQKAIGIWPVISILSLYPIMTVSKYITPLAEADEDTTQIYYYGRPLILQ